jgi:hypothetical protein
MVWLVRHRQTKGPGTDRPHLNHRATSRLYPIFRKGLFGSVKGCCRAIWDGGDIAWWRRARGWPINRTIAGKDSFVSEGPSGLRIAQGS